MLVPNEENIIFKGNLLNAAMLPDGNAVFQLVNTTAIYSAATLADKIEAIHAQSVDCIQFMFVAASSLVCSGFPDGIKTDYVSVF